MAAPPQIDTHAQVAFDNRIRFQAQQMVSVLRPTVDEEELDGEKKFFDNYGQASMIERLTRGQPNTPQELPRGRRVITPRDFEFTEEFDMQKDLVRLRRAIMSDSKFEAAILMALMRQHDDLIIEAAHGDALSGKNGNDTVTFDSNQTIANGTVLTSAQVRNYRKLLKRADVPTGELFIDLHPDEIDGMLGDTNVTSADFNTIRALADGEINSYLGFIYNQTTRIQTAANGASASHRWVTARSRDSIIFGVHPGSITTEWEKLPGRGKTWQYAVYGTMAATRQFENQIVRQGIQNPAV